MFASEHPWRRFGWAIGKPHLRAARAEGRARRAAHAASEEGSEAEGPAGFRGSRKWRAKADARS